MGHESTVYTQITITISALTFIQGTYHLNLKKIGRQLWGVEHTQEIYVATAVAVHSNPNFYPRIQLYKFKMHAIDFHKECLLFL